MFHFHGHFHRVEYKSNGLKIVAKSKWDEYFPFGNFGLPFKKSRELSTRPTMPEILERERMVRRFSLESIRKIRKPLNFRNTKHQAENSRNSGRNSNETEISGKKVSKVPPIFSGNFPFGKTKLVFPFTFQPKFFGFFFFFARVVSKTRLLIGRFT